MKIKINNIMWTVFYSDGQIKNYENLDGLCDFSHRSIVIRTDFNRDYIFRIVLHELCHATFCSLGMTDNIYKKLDQEQICEFVAYNTDNIYKNAERIMKDLEK